MLFATAQSYVVLAVILAIFVCAPRVPCEAQTYIVFFHKFSATGGGRTFGIVGTVLLLVGYTAVVCLGYVDAVRKAAAENRAHKQGCSRGAALPNATAGAPLAAAAAPPGLSTTAQQSSASQTSTALPAPGLDQDQRPPGFSIGGLAGRAFMASVAIVLVTALAVANTELLRHWNGAPAGGVWGFGQFLALALAALPGWQTVRAFRELGLGPPPKQKKSLRVHSKNKRTRGAASAAGRGAAPSSALAPTVLLVPEPSVNDDGSCSNETDGESSQMAGATTMIQLLHLGKFKGQS
jgi:hypothetical protein